MMLVEPVSFNTRISQRDIPMVVVMVVYSRRNEVNGTIDRS